MTITLSADFDAGNIIVLAQDGGRCDLEIRHDTGSDFYQWFYFRVDGAANTELSLRILNAGNSAYPDGWPEYQARVSTDNADWTQARTDYADGVLTITHTPVTDTVWFAYFAPYSTERHQALIAQYAAKPDIAHTVLGQTLDGRPLDLLTLGTGPIPVWMYARQHPGESMAEWWMEGALEALTDGNASALLEAATIYVVPNMNPDGSARGHLRTNAVGVNLNREWETPTLERSPEVYHVLNKMTQTGVAFALDVHGDEAIPHVFMAGFEGIPSFNDKSFALYNQYLVSLAAETPYFQTKHGYAVNAPGTANMTISTNAVAERFGAVAMTLEMPFKDHFDQPDPVRGWSPERSQALGRACVAALNGMITDLA
ncbi:M14-type cytosolic carboxypeptidase [Asticcacaulis sp. 201]|uniref:M14 family metallopeptidase n=1 Tax=Asticcacaulis sp. 201 TaxID=3028787 RepID=UPI002916CC47|nr:M14-type cytosolic carboxypeptidase [Asticcacaulis sp. 201]MDV6331261.1 M14-type cytosolic carboxypeptidase [Asticcacaulis sp. 201]